MPATAEAAQYEIALERANRYRLARAETKRWIRAAPTMEASRERAIEVLLDPPPHTENWEVHALIATIVRVGNSRASKILARLHIGEMRPLGKLTVRQGLELAGALREQVAGPGARALFEMEPVQL